MIVPHLIDVPAARHRLWRVYVTDNQSTAYGLVAILEVQFHTGLTGFGPRVPMLGTASADSTLDGTYVASNAVDDDLVDAAANIWASANASLPHWWQYDFGPGRAENVTGISMIARGAGSDGSGGQVRDQMPKDFDIQFSDNLGLTWKTKWSESGVAWAASQVRYFRPPRPTLYTGSPHGLHPHWRLRPVLDDGGTISSTTKITMLATPGGADQCSGGTPISDGDIGSGLVDDNAFDADNATFYGSTLTSNATYIGYSFASAVPLAEFTWRNRQDGSANQAPRTLFAQYADSLSGPWTTAFGGTPVGWSLGQTQTVTDPNYI